MSNLFGHCRAGVSVPPAEMAASVREGLGPRGAEALLCAGDSVFLRDG